jgi:2-dehydro-3-deoxyphosphogluconate aldolase/(4S)-4-hydroxy-2-oxoglutarate aldolase
MGGVRSLKAFSGPYSKVKFIPTGGINTINVFDYLNLPNVLACGGSWMVGKKLISSKKKLWKSEYRISNKKCRMSK